jgi:hypothetical protein
MKKTSKQPWRADTGRARNKPVRNVRLNECLVGLAKLKKQWREGDLPLPEESPGLVRSFNGYIKDCQALASDRNLVVNTTSSVASYAWEKAMALQILGGGDNAAISRLATALQKYQVELRYDPLHNFNLGSVAFYCQPPVSILGVGHDEFLSSRPGAHSFHECVHLLTHILPTLRNHLHCQVRFRSILQDELYEGRYASGSFDEIPAHALTLNYAFQNREDPHVFGSRLQFVDVAINTMALRQIDPPLFS